MITTVLASFPSPDQGVWYLGPVPIRAYALCIIAGIIAALVIGDRRWAARGGERGVVYDVALWAVPFGLIGGRIYHVLTDWKTYFGEGGAGLRSALQIWEGGLGIWGAIAFGGVGAWIACRRRGIPLPAFGDAVAPGIVMAQAIGRLGNYFNQELYGRETTVPWGLEIFYRRDSSGVVDVHSLDGVSTGQVAAVVHPTFLYELLWNLLVFALLIYVDRKYRLGHGRLFALYVASYCVGRFWIELMRDDTATLIAGIRVNVFTATFVFIGAVVYMLLAPKGREDPAALQGSREGLDAESPEEESLVEELAEELVAAASGSGLIAAVTVAGEHETEDAEAVGDDEFESDVHEDIEPAEIGVEIDDGADVEVVVDDDTDVAIHVDDEADVEIVVDDEADAVEVIEFVPDEERAAPADAESPDDEMVVVYASAPENEPVAVDAPGVIESGVIESGVIESGVIESEAIESEAIESEAIESEAIELDPVDSEVIELEPAELELIEAEAIEPAPVEVVEVAEVVDVVEPVVVVEPEPTAPAPDQESPGFGSSLRRLLWGVGK